MNRFEMVELLGDGTYGKVWKAVHRETRETVAIKKMKRKFYSWEECLALREVRSLRRLEHPHVIKLREVVRECDELFFIFEFMDRNLYQLMKGLKRPLPEARLRSWARQVLLGLAYIHAAGYIHRDMKPENLLVYKDVVKIADFGLAREATLAHAYTEYVSTRWYRAPEVLLRARAYGPPVDVFALGAILAELLTLSPLFPGASEADQLCRLCGVMGTPTLASWPDGLRLAARMGFVFPQRAPAALSDLLPQASPDARDLIASMVAWDPAARPTAQQALQHPFFRDTLPMVTPRGTPVPPGVPQDLGASASSSGSSPTGTSRIGAHYPPPLPQRSGAQASSTPGPSAKALHALPQAAQLLGIQGKGGSQRPPLGATQGGGAPRPGMRGLPGAYKVPKEALSPRPFNLASLVSVMPAPVNARQGQRGSPTAPSGAADAQRGEEQGGSQRERRASCPLGVHDPLGVSPAASKAPGRLGGESWTGAADRGQQQGYGSAAQQLRPFQCKGGAWDPLGGCSAALAASLLGQGPYQQQLHPPSAGRPPGELLRGSAAQQAQRAKPYAVQEALLKHLKGPSPTARHQQALAAAHSGGAKLATALRVSRVPPLPVKTLRSGGPVGVCHSPGGALHSPRSTRSSTVASPRTVYGGETPPPMHHSAREVPRADSDAVYSAILTPRRASVGHVSPGWGPPRASRSLGPLPSAHALVERRQKEALLGQGPQQLAPSVRSSR